MRRLSMTMLLIGAMFVSVSAVAGGLNDDLFQAVNDGNVAQAKALLAQGADVNAKSGDGRAPLHFAAAIMGGNLAMVRLLVGKGADVNARDGHHDTPLFYAAGVGNEKVVRYLVAKGAVVAVKDDNGATPLLRFRPGVFSRQCDVL